MSAFLPGVPKDLVEISLSEADGNELSSGKIDSPESSAALAVNTFGWFIERPEFLPRLPGIPDEEWPPRSVQIEYCARFPWSGGKHPWLDACIETNGYLIGVESKRFEPFRDKKTVSFSAAYSRPVWGSGMEPYERLRDVLAADPVKFEHLDAAQLVKHAFGLVTDARRKRKTPALIYIFAEPEVLKGRKISQSVKDRHRLEIATFAEAVTGGAVGFQALSYREWLATWPPRPNEISEHRNAVIRMFQP